MTKATRHCKATTLMEESVTTLVVEMQIEPP